MRLHNNPPLDVVFRVNARFSRRCFEFSLRRFNIRHSHPGGLENKRTNRRTPRVCELQPIGLSTPEATVGNNRTVRSQAPRTQCGGEAVAKLPNHAWAPHNGAKRMHHKASEPTRPHERTCTPSHVHDTCTDRGSRNALVERLAQEGTLAPRRYLRTVTKHRRMQVIIERRGEAATSTSAQGLYSREWAVHRCRVPRHQRNLQPEPLVCSCPSEAADTSLNSSGSGRSAALRWPQGDSWPWSTGRQRSPGRREGPDISAQVAVIAVTDEPLRKRRRRAHIH